MHDPPQRLVPGTHTLPVGFAPRERGSAESHRAQPCGLEPRPQEPDVHSCALAVRGAGRAVGLQSPGVGFSLIAGAGEPLFIPGLHSSVS